MSENSSETSPLAEPTADSLHDTLNEVREEIAASTGENRRTARRMLDGLKQFSEVLDAISGTVNDVHRQLRAENAARTSASSAGAENRLPQAHLMGLVELADRLRRLTLAFERQPPQGSAWWPGTARRLQAWEDAWRTQSEAVGILSGHLETLLRGVELRRIPVLGLPFDPTCMSAVEMVQDARVPEQTVLEELVSGWTHGPNGQVLRPAQVRVARR